MKPDEDRALYDKEFQQLVWLDISLWTKNEKINAN
jgi:hypothetical protein